MYVGALTLDILLGDVRSLKQKRSVVRPIIAEVLRRYPGVAVAETGHLDLHRRSQIGIAVVSATAANCGEVLQACERLVAFHHDPERSVQKESRPSPPQGTAPDGYGQAGALLDGERVYRNQNGIGSRLRFCLCDRGRDTAACDEQPRPCQPDPVETHGFIASLLPWKESSESRCWRPCGTS